MLIDHNTTASLSGQVHCNFLKYCVHYPMGILILLVVLIVSQISALYVITSVSSTSRISTFIIIGFAVAFFTLRIYRNHIRAACYHGDLCAGRVVSINPLHVAFFTDLTTGRQSFPVIKIVKPPIKKTFDNKILQVGDRLAAVALYQPSRTDVRRWSDFDPKPVQCYTFDTIQIKNATSRIPQELWDELENGIRLIGEKTQTLGLHFIIE